VRIVWAFVFGSVASGKDTSASDIDLMIIGDLGFSEVMNALYPLQETLGREVNPKVYRKDEWTRLLKADDAFVREVMTKPRMDVMGGDDGLG
jgi:predicted nucleotidyltransferase